MKKIIIILLAVMLMTVTVYALPEVYEIPMTVDYPVDCWGVFQVPCIGTRSPLYEATPSEWQDVIDADNSALIRRYAKGYAIHDHAGSVLNSGHLWRVEDMQVGCGGFLCREGKGEICYECTAIYLTEQRGNDFYWHNKAIRPEQDCLICVSCADEDGWVYVAYFEMVGVMP